MSHCVVFDQGNKSKPYDIEKESSFKEWSALMKKLGYKWVYTDLFTGTEDECLVFCKRHNLKL